SMNIGSFIGQFIPPIYATYAGGIILVCLGLFLLSSLVWTKIKMNNNSKHSYSSFIKNPAIVDADNSGTLSVTEAFILGIALALDAFGAGFAAAILGFSVFSTSFLIVIASCLFVYSGFKFGHILSLIKWINEFIFLPPILLIIIGTLSFL